MTGGKRRDVLVPETVGEIMMRAERLFGPRNTLGWLVTPLPALDGKAPAERLLDHPDGARAVVRVLQQLEELTGGIAFDGHLPP